MRRVIALLERFEPTLFVAKGLVVETDAGLELNDTSGRPRRMISRADLDEKLAYWEAREIEPVDVEGLEEPFALWLGSDFESAASRHHIDPPANDEEWIVVEGGRFRILERESVRRILVEWSERASKAAIESDSEELARLAMSAAPFTPSASAALFFTFHGREKRKRELVWRVTLKRNVGKEIGVAEYLDQLERARVELLGTHQPERPENTFIANGALDDHLRLTALIALWIQGMGDVPHERIAPCLDPASSWNDRSTALWASLEKLDTNGEPPLLIAASALMPDDPARSVDYWDDFEFRRERREFALQLEEIFSERGWLMLEAFPGPGAFASQEPLSVPPPWYRRLIAMLESSGLLSAKEAADRLLGHWNARSEDLAAVRETLTEEEWQAAELLSAARVPMSLNGAVGLFSAGPAGSGFVAPSPAAVRRLVELGVLDTFGEGHVWMPRSIRTLFPESSEDERLEAVHRWLSSAEPWNREASAYMTPEGVVLERHHYALTCKDLVVAKETARHYVSDLRSIGRELSLERSFDEAAEVYQYICKTNESDAYAWHYLGYNLARADDRYAGRHREKIRDAYAKAVEFDPGNPLYLGRFLGYRGGEMAEDIRGDFIRTFSRLQGQPGNRLAVQIFVERVFKGLIRTRRVELMERLKLRFRRELTELGLG